MSMLHWTLPSEMAAGSAGEQPAKGYLGGAHRDDGQGAGSFGSSRPTPNKSIGLKDPSCLKKRNRQHALTTVQGSGSDTLREVPNMELSNAQF